jgi:hypothetical protein
MVPVLVLTGFLGSGKTTLLNRVLARRAERAAEGRIAVIVNELGAVGIDGDLLAGGARQVELPGGCVCCVLGDELDRTVLELIAANPGLDAIVLETTGVAEPLPIAWAFDRPPLAGAARLAAVVTLVDATRFIESRPISPAVDEQVKHADAIVVTKRDLTSAGDHRRGGRERAIADIDLHVHVATGAHGHAHEAGDPSHGIVAVWLPIPSLVDLEELEDQLAALPAAYIRIKGLARVVFHRVGLRVSSEPIAGPVEPRVVALGAAVEPGPLAACIEAAVLSSPAGVEG